MIKRLCGLFLFLCTQIALAAVDLELTQGVNAALPIGINAFSGAQQVAQLQDIIEGDLRFSGQFKIIQTPGTSNPAPVAMWREAGADSVLSARMNQIGSNYYDVNYELADAAAHGRLLLSKSYQVRSEDLRALAHHISDEVYQKLTGERGVFSTRIAYVLVQRNGKNARYFLEVADVDGHNPQSLLVSSEPIMSPSWSPDGRQIAYVSFEKKRAQIFTVSVETGKRRLVTDFPGINGAPAWSPDGRELAVVLSKAGTPKIYTVDLSSGAMKQLTFGEAIDTEPRYSPDGRSLLFTSGRGGSPQVYRLSLADGKISRMTFTGNYNARASYTPNQRQMVMLHREDGHFNIGVQNMDTGQVTKLTFSPMDESPSIAPNGRLILYATRYQDKGVLAMVSVDGRARTRLPSRDGDVQEPAWSPYLG
ncbi:MULTISPECIES: Tol-Pal system beta propeller repeat protein TolB [Legionella]|uniref:Tol-Pal system protein TolB n=1 Tax=Legionella septentrionalis TaxID=2498109 RepID=A0A3S0V5Z2_9GAMM|nr:Tol-Pal system beta propeller repeat protein TolB [Legionella septentrionalis]MCP0914481.1 Tol-Pal system beta propeller repeat protein TolB [Legionella sp. 27cVA30]RUQ89457.1 Tol-Pal system beta propeller repeat protein TolB [Legionella septentrionalis]RUQ97298.1 Tol-Pal system beta propeller repeat protein TolB [Legionella septentrionalis]RUR10470.1 Tol-Pal system beta propeller repeat protein TolB [Legionella septentrionalis]RUR16090.1 Tol-Pal system beta propeller repeat protein TolB [L